MNTTAFQRPSGRRRALPWLAACGLSVLSACSAPAVPAGAATPAPPAAALPATGAVTLQGVLLLRGNAPHAEPVLQTASGEIWRLDGISEAQIDQWQRQTVEVQGEAAPRMPAGAGAMPHPLRLRVQAIRGMP
ncbi:MAG: hypothetical protein LBI66_10870 [Burkholderiaceae bacterium]|nr:hypothetical protein [Burkholderiaceae bacterium]